MSFGRMVLAAYAVLMAIGGVWGYAGKHSKVSLFAGIGSAIVLAGIYKMAESNPKNGLMLGAFVTLLLTGNFVSTYMRKHNFIPSGLFGIISVIALVCLTISVIQTKN